VGGIGLAGFLPDLAAREAEAGGEGIGEDAADPAAASLADPSTLDGRIAGGGSTFMAMPIDTWSSGYRERQPEVEIFYDPLGSGAGAYLFSEGETDFGSSENPLTVDGAALAEQTSGCPVVEFPVVTGAVAVIYNLGDDVGREFTAAQLAAVYQGEIRDAGELFGPGSGLEHIDLVPVRHEEGAATAQVFERYLETAPAWSAAWADSVQEAGGDEGVAAAVAATVGAIGFVNAAYAEENGLQVADLVDPEGNVVELNEESTRAAAEQIDLSGSDFSLTGRVTTPGYPIMRVNHVFAFECGYDEGVGAVVRDFWLYAQSEEGAALSEHKG
jgi:ABC-type phosphate transport system substrate-binding protein